MKEKNEAIKHGLYRDVATMLKCEGHEHRFPGHGLVRYFGTDIQVSLRNPTLHGVFHRPRDALAAIRRALEHDFYQNVGMLLSCDAHYRKFPFHKRTRWNNRQAGNGRFQGHGLVRFFGPSNIHVSLHDPEINGRFTGSQEALAAIVSKII